MTIASGDAPGDVRGAAARSRGARLARWGRHLGGPTSGGLSGLRRREEVRRVARLVVLSLAALALVVGVGVNASAVPMTTLMVPLLLGSLVLPPRQVPAFVAWMVLMVAASLLLQPQVTVRIGGAVVIELVMCGIVLATALRRARLGVPHLSGDAMFVDLRDRLLNQGTVPPLPAGWSSELALRSASGTRFAGDFLVATRLADPDRLELVLVDVSGKGDQAGTRALQLSGAFGGILGSVPSCDFLPAANAYLLRQQWSEGFATAVHVRVDLDDGSFELATAGHPPALLRVAGSGRWQPVTGDGPVLGLLEEAQFSSVRGRLARGDSLVLYTDGMVEEPRRDISLGVDALTGAAESLLRSGVPGVAGRLVERVGTPGDDRAVVWLHRS
ncbi:PP2C family protein-serine/threonine phosphatase [Nocardioides sp. GY 10127]|uniref:PP2C family protein-serine/threonine phosphatase n=1 Tax=Nocardioides sp. GY 10127 TaxID=2569762 RepID=UPI0010A8A02E|nr:PP2C family protein-serine/threonine phosphatase [Nocardioides sp. GY 10127]TIC80734.1 serine/threonine-protein phosphatase [Nocardioides sp. GY 10127]